MVSDAFPAFTVLALSDLSWKVASCLPYSSRIVVTVWETWPLSNSPCVLLCPCLSSFRLAVLSLWFGGDLKPVYFSLSWRFWDGKWLSAGMCWIWVPCVFCREFQEVFAPWCPGLWYKMPLYTSPKQLRGAATQFREGAAQWTSHSTRAKDGKRVLQALRLSCNPSLPSGINLRQTAKVSANPTACVDVSACPCQRSLTKQQISCLFPFLSASPAPGTFVCLPPTSPLVSESISLEKGWQSSSQFQALSQLPSPIHLCSCSSASAHLPCTFSISGAERGGWKKEFIH